MGRVDISVINFVTGRRIFYSLMTDLIMLLCRRDCLMRNYPFLVDFFDRKVSSVLT